MKKISRRVELWHWVDGSGYTHNETFENTQEDFTAAEWIEGLDEPFEIDEGEGIEVRIYDNETDELLSHQWM